MFGWWIRNIFGLRKHQQSQLTDTDLGHTGSSWDTQLVPCHLSKKGCREPLSMILHWCFGHHIGLLEREDKPSKRINLNDVTEALPQTPFFQLKIVMEKVDWLMKFWGAFFHYAGTNCYQLHPATRVDAKECCPAYLTIFYQQNMKVLTPILRPLFHSSVFQTKESKEFLFLVGSMRPRQSLMSAITVRQRTTQGCK